MFLQLFICIPFPILTIPFGDDVIGCIQKSDYNLNFVSEGAFSGLFGRKIEVLKVFRIYLIGREKQLA